MRVLDRTIADVEINYLNKKITVVIPVYNEEENIERLVNQLSLLSENKIKPRQSSVINEELLPDLSLFEWEFLFINDGSKDNSYSILMKFRNEDERIKILNLSRNFGKENAMLAGFDYATGDAIIIIDADLQDPLNVIPEMIYYWLCGYDDVYGKRKFRGQEPIVRKILSLLFYKLLKDSSKVEIPSNVGDFRLLDKRVLSELRNLRESERYTKGLFGWVGFNKKEIQFIREDRIKGKSSFNLLSLFNLAINGLTSFTIKPLRISTFLGLIVSLISLVYLVYILFKTIIYGDPVAGFPSLMCVILFLGGLQLITIGIIGEYVGRIFTESKNRPVYIVESFNGESQQDEKFYIKKN